VFAWLDAHGKLSGAVPDAEPELWRLIATLPGGRVPLPSAAGAVEHLLASVPAAPGRGLDGGARWRTAMTISPDVARCLDEVAADLGASVLAARIAERTSSADREAAPFTASGRLGELVASLVPQDLADRARLTVFDPACDAGNLLVPLADRLGTRHTYVAFDPDPAMVRISATRLALVGCRAVESTVADWHGEGLAGATERVADVVVSGPPPTVRGWDEGAASAYDPRWVFGVPSRVEVELAWLQHCYAAVKEGGVCILVMPAQVGSRPTGRKVRTELVRSGALTQVLALPPGLADVHHTVALQAWVVRRPDPRAALPVVATVRMADASGFTEEQLEQAVASGWRAVADDPHVVRDVPLIDLLDDEVDLSPTRRIEPPAADVVGPLRAARAELAAALGGLAAVVPDFAARAATPPDPGAAPGSTLTVADLARIGAVRLLPAGTSLEADDILVDPAADGRARTADAAEVGAPGGLPVLRCDRERLDPYFLLGHLRSTSNRRLAATGTLRTRMDVRRARVPRVPVEQQRLFGAVVREAVDFAASVRRAAELAADLADLACDGAASAVLLPAAPAAGRSQ
jgi:hypothetical protein